MRAAARNSPRPGFTLLEALVLTAIIALLCALLLPALSRAKGRAQRIQCMGNLRQFGVGLQNFLANNHGYPSYDAPPNDDYAGGWPLQFEMFGFGVSQPPEGVFSTGVWRCPSAQFRPYKMRPAPERHYYSFNTFGLGYRTNGLGLGGCGSPTSSLVRTRELDVMAPSAMMAFGDAFDGGWVFCRRLTMDYLIKEGNILTRHQGRGNVVFCDGHVESPTVQFLFLDSSDEALSRWNRDHQPHHELLP
jgi:prepilin-type processing-associated H-X9-DG protein